MLSVNNSLVYCLFPVLIIFLVIFLLITIIRGLVIIRTSYATGYYLTPCLCENVVLQDILLYSLSLFLSWVFVGFLISSTVPSL